MGGRTAGPNLPSTRAGGQDDGSYTNSLKLINTEIVTSCQDIKIFYNSENLGECLFEVFGFQM